MRSLAFITVVILLASSLSWAIVFNDPGFTIETVVTVRPYTILDVAFAPDGRIFLLRKNGIIRIFKDGALLPTPFLDISSKVNIINDRGALGMALDPNFVINGYVYLAYVYEQGGDPTDQGPKTSRISRFKADPNNPDEALTNSEFVLLGSIGNPSCAAGTDCIRVDSDSHSIGTIRFAPDGTMFIGTGDGAGYDDVDIAALRAQNLNSLNGKILRINSDGTAPHDNPFFTGNNVPSKVWAYGLRNPFRFAIDPLQGEPLIGDVGWDDWEEISRGRGKNFGWPCYEGPNVNPFYQTLTQCQDLPPANVTAPFYSYNRFVGATVIGGAFYTGNEYPNLYRGNFFFADYTSDWIRRIVFDGGNNLDKAVDFATDAGNIVDLELGPDGFLYYVSFSTGELRRIRFNGPFASASAVPASGYSPLPVNFSSAGSFDPQNLPLTFSWDFGDSATSSVPDPSHIYTTGTVTTYDVVLTVTNSINESSSDNLSVTVGSLPPVATILSPADATIVQPGDTINYLGSATDPDDGSLPSSALSWTTLLHHDSHVHSFLTSTGISGSLLVEDHGPGTYSYEFILTATDSSGLTGTDTHNVSIQTPCIFCDDFADGVLAPNWTYVKVWNETSGNVVATATKKARAIATPAFAGCTRCYIETEMMTAGGKGNRVSLFGWYQGKDVNVELMMKEESDRWIIKERSGGTTKKAKGNRTIDPNVSYKVRLAFNGSDFRLFVDGQLIIIMAKGPETSPSGTVGFQVKKTTGTFAEIGVH